MIVEYNRPRNLEEALDLLSRKEPETIPLGGGTYLSQHNSGNCAVVDLQQLGLELIIQSSGHLQVGATVTLNQLLELDLISLVVKNSILKEKNNNIRQKSTIAGTLITGNGHSIFTGIMLAMDVKIIYQPGSKTITLEEFLGKRKDWKGLITHITIPLETDIKWEAVTRTPSDFPYIYIAVSKWQSGKCRVVMGGNCKTPILIANTNKLQGVENNLDIACSHFGTQWAPLQYYQEIFRTLLKRTLA